MNCREIKKSLPDFIDGKLSSEKNQEINDHFDHCADCSLLYKNLLNTLEVLKPKAEITEQAFYYTRLKQRIENEKTNSTHFINVFFIKKYSQAIVYLASLMIAVYIGILIGSGSSGQNQFTEAASIEQDYIQSFAEYQYLNDFELEKIENVLVVNTDSIKE